jgi:disulfide bond formation protein DsbB
MLTTRSFAGFVLTASAVVLGAALASEYWGGLAPCELCLLQRWPWWLAIAVAAAAWLAGDRLPPAVPAILLGMVFVASAGVALYHVGVEQHWFAGPSACTGSITGATSIEALKAQLLARQPVSCDAPSWTLFGVSLAGLNLIASALLTVACAAAILRGGRR